MKSDDTNQHRDHLLEINLWRGSIVTVLLVFFFPVSLLVSLIFFGWDKTVSFVRITRKMIELPGLWVSHFISNIAALVLFFIVAVTCVDVIGRYFFNAPLYAGSELVQVSMAGVIFLSLPVMFFRHEHIVVDLFSIFQRGYLGWILSIIFLTISAYCLWIVADKTWFYAMRALEDGDTYEYILMPSFLSSGKEEFAPRFVVETFIALSLYFTSLLIAIRLLIVIFKPGLNAEDSVGLE